MTDTRIATDTMKAFVFKGIGETAVDEKPIPEPAPNEAVVRTTTALVCTSDVHTVKGAIPVEPNVTLGHEAVGVVHSLGSAVEGFHEAAAVVARALMCPSPAPLASIANTGPGRK